MIYADNAATTKLDAEALEAMLPFFQSEYANASQPYSFSRGAKRALKAARETIANCIGANPSEIYFTSGGTESDNWAIKGFFLKRKKSGVILTTPIEHHAVLKSTIALQEQGHSVLFTPVDSKGCVRFEDFKSLICPGVDLVSIMLANNEVGTLQPVRELAAISHENGALFHTDAVQAVGHIHVDVSELNVDMLSASAHKFNGPKGIGFLYVKEGTPLFPYADGGAQEHGQRAGTENVALCVGMATALKNACARIEKTSLHLIELENQLISQLRIKGLDFLRNGSPCHIPGNVSLSFRNTTGEILLHRLDLMGICVSTGSACDSKNQRISHVIEALDVPSDYANGTIRISLGYENTSTDIDAIVQALTKVLL